MKIGKEKEVKYCNFDVIFEDSEFKMLRDYGLREIEKDDNSLVNYAVNKIMVKQIEDSKKEKNNKQKVRSVKK